LICRRGRRAIPNRQRRSRWCVRCHDCVFLIRG
jgi:hypothetical protein